MGVKERLNLFSTETRQQFLIGQEIVKQTKGDSGTPRDKLLLLMRSCLTRDAGWKAYHAKKMVRLTPVTPDPAKLDIAVAERNASHLFRGGACIEAAELVQKELGVRNLQPIPIRDGLPNWPRRTCTGRTRRSQEMQRRAYEWNRYLFRPVAGIRYQRMIAKAGVQAQNTLDWIRSHTDPNAIIVSVETLVNSLSFGVNHSRFEAAWAELGTILGFTSERPEEVLGKGPDGLWAMPENQYLLAEIKNEVELNRKEIYQSEAEQMSNQRELVLNGVRQFGEGGSDDGTSHQLPGEIRLSARAHGDHAPQEVGESPRTAAGPGGRPIRKGARWVDDSRGRCVLASHRLDAASIRSNYCIPTKRSQ